MDNSTSHPTVAARTPDDLQTFLDAHAPGAALVRELGDTPTVPTAARVLGVATDQIMKTLLFRVESTEGTTLIVVISHGERRVDRGMLAAHCGVGKKRVSLAPADVVLATIGFPAGGVPPFGHARALPALLDASVVENAARYGGIFYAGGGDDRTMLRLHLDDLLRVSAPTIVPLS